MRLLLIIMFVFFSCCSIAQEIGATSYQGGYVTYGEVIGADTIPIVYLPDVEVVGKMPKHLAKQRRKQQKAADELALLRRRVRKVYPYAVTAAVLLKDVDANLAKLEGNKSARKKYLKQVEQSLNDRFRGELENLTISEGQILVKLINRQTGRNCFSLIQELKGGFSAVVWQSVALLFNNNLRKEYDPTGRDRDLEMVTKELEASVVNRY